MRPVVLGIEKLATEPGTRKKIHGRRIGLVAHPASTDSNLRHAIDALADAGARIEALFGPEHGLGGEAQDMEPVAGAAIGPMSLPLFSLYGRDEKSLAPSEEALLGLDALVVDLFDVGARYYTFVWTSVLCLRICHKLGLDLILTDRPNPLGGQIVEGAPQKEGFLSFVGLSPVSNRHGLTAGEIVSMAAKQEGIGDALDIVPMDGWRRSMLFGETGLPWVMPSPNMPTFETALVYPGLCLIEGTWASEGRGTARPFELVGAPGIDGRAVASRLEKMKLEGVRFRPVSFKPGFQKHAGKICGGVQIHVTDPRGFPPYRTGVAVLLALRAEAGQGFKWRDQPYEFVTDRPAIDLLTGSTAVREGVEQGAALDEIEQTWLKGEAEFRQYRREFFLY
jgi:uncharacterized protein YbbC (DUF1343 family)